MRALLDWRDDPHVHAVAIRGTNKEGPFGAFCAGGDIRFFHQAALTGDPQLEDFFTQEYALNHLIHTFPKPYVAFMDGIVMGGGMGISQGARLRLVTERTKMAMPETNIGLFPDVGGGYFLSRCPGQWGEYLALTGQVISGVQAVACGLADVCVAADQLDAWWGRLASCKTPTEVDQFLASLSIAADACQQSDLANLDAEISDIFSQSSVPQIIEALEASSSELARHTAAQLRQRSPLMLHVTLMQIRRARHMSLADDLRMERDMVRHCFHLRTPARSETVEGIRALAIDKDHQPRWSPSRIEEVSEEDVAAFFESPWPTFAHPLRHL
jgi:enoyl-CoA hydratase